MSELTLQTGSELIDIVGELQKYTADYLCVRDDKLIIYHKLQQIPINLILRRASATTKSGIVCYIFKDSSHSYTFFNQEVKKYLCKLSPDNDDFIGSVVRSKGSGDDDKNTVTFTGSL